MNVFGIREAFGTMDGLSVPVALLVAVVALYLGNEAVAIVRAITQEEAGFKGPMIDKCRFLDFARKPEFILLLLTAVVAARGGSWWVGVPLCFAGLSIARLPKYISMWPRATEIGAEWQAILAVTLSSVLSLVSALGIFAVGACTSWLLR